MNTTQFETMNISEVHDMMVDSADIYFAKDEAGNYLMNRRRARPICLMGGAGIGKTEIVGQVAKELELAFCSYSITHHTRQSLLGLPRLVESQVGDVIATCTEYTMSEIIAQIHRAMAESGKSEGILFLDEFNCASESIRPVMLQLLQDKRFGAHAIPEGWMLVLAGNPTEYNRSASTLDAVTMDRLRMVYVEADFGCWRDYAKGKGIHPVVLAYLENNKRNFCVYQKERNSCTLVTPRGWEDLAIMLTHLELRKGKVDGALVGQYIQAPNIVRDFLTFYHQYGMAVASGLAEEVLTGHKRAALRLSSLSVEQSWGVVTMLVKTVCTKAEEAVCLDDVAGEVHPVLLRYKGVLQSGDESVSDGLMKAAMEMHSPAAQSFLTECAMAPADENRWETVKNAFQSQLNEPRLAAFAQVEEMMENLISVCRVGLEGKPHLEHLFNGLCENAAVVNVISASDAPHFKQLLSEIGFGAERVEAALTAAVNQRKAV